MDNIYFPFDLVQSFTLNTGCPNKHGNSVTKSISSLYCKFLVLRSTTIFSQNINKQIVNVLDENLTDYSFLSTYQYTKSKNYFERRYWIRHWIPMFIGTPCTLYVYWETLYLICNRNRQLSTIKGTVSIISSDLPFKEGYPRFTTVPFKSLTE